MRLEMLYKKMEEIRQKFKIKTYITIRSSSYWAHINIHIHNLLNVLNSTLYSLNVQEWKSTLLGIILGITSFGVEIHAQYSGIHSQMSDSNHYFESRFPLQIKWS